MDYLIENCMGRIDTRYNDTIHYYYTKNNKTNVNSKRHYESYYRQETKGLYTDSPQIFFRDYYITFVDTMNVNLKDNVPLDSYTYN